MIPSLRTSARLVYGGRCSRSVTDSGPTQPLAADGVPYSGAVRLPVRAVRLCGSKPQMKSLTRAGSSEFVGVRPGRSGCLCRPQHRTVSDPLDAN